jgi:hypothetical protein
MRALFRIVSAVVGCGLFAVGAGHAADGVALRVESEVFVDDTGEPASRSLTLFDGETTWDFLAASAGKDEAAAGVAGCRQIILHDPARERLVALDPRLKVKTQIDCLRLERLSASLGKWARSADDKLIRWAGDVDIGSGIVARDGAIELKGPRVCYTVEYADAPSPAAADAYRGFADTAILLKALLQPGGLPPFPRLAINRHVAATGGIPSEVRLELGGPLPLLGASSATLRSVHRTLSGITDADRRQIDDAAALMAVAEELDLAGFIDRRATDEVARRGS